MEKMNHQQTDIVVNEVIDDMELLLEELMIDDYDVVEKNDDVIYIFDNDKVMIEVIKRYDGLYSCVATDIEKFWEAENRCFQKGIIDFDTWGYSCIATRTYATLNDVQGFIKKYYFGEDIEEDIIDLLKELEIGFEMDDDIYRFDNGKIEVYVSKGHDDTPYYCMARDIEVYKQLFEIDPVKDQGLYWSIDGKSIIARNKYQTLNGVRDFINKYYLRG